MSNFVSDPNNREATMGGAIPDPNDIGNLLSLFMQGHKQVGNLLGQHIKSKLYPQQSQGMDSQLGPLQDNGLGMPNLPLNSGQFSGQGVSPAFQNIQPATGDYMNVAMGHQQAMADALRRASAMQPPKMGAPVNKHNAGLLALASLLPLLFAKNKGMGLGGAVQGFMGAANQEQQREFSNNMGAYNTQKQGLLTEADIQNQIANQNLALESGQSAQAMELRKLEAQKEIAGINAKASYGRASSASEAKLRDEVFKAPSGPLREAAFAMLRDQYPGKYDNNSADQIAAIGQRTSLETKNYADAEMFGYQGEEAKAKAKQITDMTPYMIRKIQSGVKVDEATAAHLWEQTKWMPKEKQTQILKGMAEYQKLIADVKRMPFEDMLKLNDQQISTLNARSANAKTGLTGIESAIRDYQTKIEAFNKELDKDPTNQHLIDTLNNLEQRLSEAQDLAGGYRSSLEALNKRIELTGNPELRKATIALQDPRVKANPKLADLIKQAFTKRTGMPWPE